MTFGRTLQELTRLCGVKRCNLADALGYDPSYISRWINGVKHPSLRSNDRAARADRRLSDRQRRAGCARAHCRAV